MTTAEMQNSGRSQDRLQCCKVSLAFRGPYTLSEEKHVRSVSVCFGLFWSVWVDFGRFRSVSVGFGLGFRRFQTVSEVSRALGGALRRVLSVKC